MSDEPMNNIVDRAVDAYAVQRRRADEWLAGLTVGAQVGIVRGYHGRTPEVTTITGKTSRYWEIRGQRFRKDTGRMVGGSKWHSAWLTEPTLEIIELDERKRLYERLACQQWPRMSLSSLRTMVAALEVCVKVDAKVPNV
jgi:hypothetical protein